MTSKKGTSVLRELCRQDKVQQPHKKLDQVWLRGVETSDGSLDNVKKTKTTNTRPDMDAKIERFNVESEHDVVLVQLSTNDGSVGTNDMPAALDHRLEVRTQKKKHQPFQDRKITVIADGPCWRLTACESLRGCERNVHLCFLLLASKKPPCFSSMTLDSIARSVMIPNV